MKKTNADSHFILLIQCKDEKGLISKVTTILFENECNVTEMKEHVDEVTNTFYMRCEFIGSGDMTKIKELLRSKLQQNAIVNVYSKAKKQIVVFATKEHHCLSDLLVRNHFGEIGAEIKCVISNHAVLKSFVEKFNIEFHHVSNENKSHEQFESELVTIVEKHTPDYLVLAKFMRVLSSGFVGKYPQQIINIHHSFLPAFIGANPYQQAHDRGIKMIGATAHFVTEELDQGPIISQHTKQVDHSYSVEDMRISGREIEKDVLLEALQSVFEDRVFVTGNKTVILD